MKCCIDTWLSGVICSSLIFRRFCICQVLLLCAGLMSFSDGVGRFAWNGDLTSESLSILKKEVEKLTDPHRVVLGIANLRIVGDTDLNYLLFMK